MSLYRDIIAKALTVSWRAKYLWVLAFFAVLAGSTSEYELVFSGSDSLSGQSTLIGFLRAFYEKRLLLDTTAGAQEFFGTHIGLSILVILLVLLVAAFIIWLVLAAQGGLVAGLGKLLSSGQTDFVQSFAKGMKAFTRVFMVNLLFRGSTILLLLVLAVPFAIAYIRTGGLVYNSLYILLSYIILVPVTVLLSFIVKYAVTYIVVRDQKWRQAFANGWRMFIKNWLASLEVAFLLFIIHLVLSLILVFTLFMLGLPTNPAGLVILFVIVGIYAAILTTFQYATWVQLFFGLEAGTVKSKILRMTERWSNPKIAKPATK